MKISIIQFLLMLIISSCNGIVSDFKLESGKIVDVKSLNEINTYIHDESNGFSKDKQINDFLYTVNYIPNQLISNAPVANTTITDNYQYYNYIITYSKADDIFKALSMDMEDYDRKIQYASFFITKDFYLVLEEDTLPCVLSHFERNYGLSNKINIQLAFKKWTTKPDNKFMIVYDDKLFSNGKIILTMNSDALLTQFNLK